MSDSHRAPSPSSSKRAASPTNAVAETPTHRQRLSSSMAATADSPSAARPPLSAAQKCADDALIIVFGFIEFDELLCAAQTCHAWYSAAAKEKSRGVSRSFWLADRLTALCTSSSPFRRHVSGVYSNRNFSLSLNQLAELRQLPELTALGVRLSAAALTRLLNKDGGGALAELKAAFPPKLRELTLMLSDSHSTALCQLLLDALPATEGLERLSLTTVEFNEPIPSSSLSLEPLLQLPCLTQLTWELGDLTVPQLLIIKQIATLRYFSPGEFEWTVDQLAALCRPPHRLQRLEELDMGGIGADEEVMAELVHLPALISFDNTLMPGAFAFLPRFPRLQRLEVYLDTNADAEQQAEHKALLVSALSACPALTHLILSLSDCTETFGSQLVQAAPRLRRLHLGSCSLPSLRFLRHAPNLQSLSLYRCPDVRPGHVVGIGAFAPQLKSLWLSHCAGLQLDEVERRLLTPPGALGLPNLHKFKYCKPLSAE